MTFLLRRFECPTMYRNTLARRTILSADASLDHSKDLKPSQEFRKKVNFTQCIYQKQVHKKSIEKEIKSFDTILSTLNEA